MVMNKYNVWNKWDKLKTVFLGDIYKQEFYDGIKTKEIRDGLLKITEESLEDLDYYEKVLKDFGCNVIRPKINSNANIMDYMIDGKIQGIVPRPPLQVRDHQFVCGNTLVYTSDEKTSYIHDTLKEYNNDDVTDIKTKTRRRDWGWAPNFTLVGKDLYSDTADRKMNINQMNALKKAVNNIRINYIRIGGHNDACFHTIKPGAIISLYEIQAYENTFPKWDVLYLPNQSWSKVSRFIELKRKNKGKWWVPGEEDNDELTFFIESWLNDWVGYVEETVFDVNVLVLDKHHVAVSNIDNKEVNAFLKKHKMEPVHVPWRHRYFHDGGLHCITLDLYREGAQQDYFPSRSNKGVIDHGYD